MKYFHGVMKEVCDKNDPAYYPKLKKWADEYFLIKHRWVGVVVVVVVVLVVVVVEGADIPRFLTVLLFLPPPPLLSLPTTTTTTTIGVRLVVWVVSSLMTRMIVSPRRSLLYVRMVSSPLPRLTCPLLRSES